MIAGYVWLGIAGIVLIVLPPGTSVFAYDAAVHAIAIGFVLSMVLGHAPIILPAVTGWRVRYAAAAYAPLALLHASVLLRIVADLGEVVALRGVSALLTILALFAYAATLAVVSRRGPARTFRLTRGPRCNRQSLWLYRCSEWRRPARTAAERQRSRRTLKAQLATRFGSSGTSDVAPGAGCPLCANRQARWPRSLAKSGRLHDQRKCSPASAGQRDRHRLWERLSELEEVGE
jgi:hypothetical protein